MACEKEKTNQVIREDEAVISDTEEEEMIDNYLLFLEEFPTRAEKKMKRED